MKQIRLISLAAVAILCASCGASRQAQQQQAQQYPNYGGYQPQPQQGYYQQQPPQGYYQQQPQQGYYQQQYQSQQGPDASGYVEIKKSPIEELSMVCGTGEIRSYGSAESGNEQMALNAARAQATAALQEKIEVYVRAGLDNYAQETGVNGQYSLDESTRNQVMTAVKGIVKGASVVDSRKMYNPTTKRFKYEVCMKYDRAGVLEVMQQQSERILANEKKFEQDMQAAWDALDAENQRVSLGEQQQQRQNQMEQNNMDRQHQRDMQYQQQQNQYDLQYQQQQNQYNLEQQRLQNQNNGQNQVPSQVNYN